MKNGLLRSPTVQVRVSTDKKGLKRINTNRHGPNPITSPYIQNCLLGLKIQVYMYWWWSSVKVLGQDNREIGVESIKILCMA